MGNTVKPVDEMVWIRTHVHELLTPPPGSIIQASVEAGPMLAAVLQHARGSISGETHHGGIQSQVRYP